MKHFIRVVASTIDWSLVALLGWTGYCLDFNLEQSDAPDIAKNLIEITQEKAVEVVIATAVGIAACRFVRWVSQEPSEERRKLDELATAALEKFRDSIYDELPEDVPNHENRVTLFQYCPYVWWIWPPRGFGLPHGFGYAPWSGWLVARYRTGHITKKSMAVFPGAIVKSCVLSSVRRRPGGVRLGRVFLGGGG